MKGVHRVVADARFCLGAGDFVGICWQDTSWSIRPPGNESAALGRRRGLARRSDSLSRAAATAGKIPPSRRRGQDGGG